jgi:acetoin utilization protein AcuB
MKISEIMMTNVISIPSDMSIVEARRVMEANHYRRLPVIDRGKLVGIITRDAIERMGPSKLTTFSIHELTYLLSTIKVKDLMHKDVVTILPDAYAADAVALALTNRVGMLVVVENDKVVGVATTTDFFNKLLNPMLGINLPGTRIYIANCTEASDVEKVISYVKNAKVKIFSIALVNAPGTSPPDLVIQLDVGDHSKAIDDIKKLGFQVTVKPSPTCKV